MQDSALSTISGVARQLNVSRATVADLCRLWGVAPKRMRHARGLAKGLDASDVRLLRTKLNLIARQKPGSDALAS